MSSVNGLDFSMSNNAWADELPSIVAVKVVPLMVIFICWLLLSLLLLVGCSVAELVGSKSLDCLLLDGITKNSIGTKIAIVITKTIANLRLKSISSLSL